MNNLIFDIKKWKKFALGDERYFHIKRGESEYIKNMTEGDFPYISTTKENNGIVAYVDRANRNGNLISLAYDGTIGACFYQKEPFFASEKIVTINTVQKELNEKLAIFLIEILKLESKMFSYGGRKWTVEQQLKATEIKLPVGEDGEPDYVYMENYINSINGDLNDIPDYFIDEGYKKACWYLDNIDQNKFENEYAGVKKKRKIALSDRDWNYFEIESDLGFEVKNAKSYNSSDLINSIDEDYIYYITRTGSNNGISMYVQADEFEGIEDGNAITIGDTTTTIFYQKQKFIAGPHIIVLRASWLNVYIAEFIISIINKEKYRYPVFGRAFTKELIKKTKLYLPTDNTGKPDFKFMEDYIKSLPFSVNI